MALIDELKSRIKEFKSDGYPMSIGEIINLYEAEEIIINPNFQRFFRWTVAQKSRFIESILLGIPTPAIFVYQRDDGVWELVDGLQRLSTILEFVGKLRDGVGQSGAPVKLAAPLKLSATKLLPSLQGITWEEAQDDSMPIPKSLQLDFKRSKIKVEIIQKESDVNAKFEVFQRLNTGGTFLSEQEVRNCLLVMLNEPAFNWLESLSKFVPFQNCISLTDRALAERYDMELVLKFQALMRRDLAGKDVSDFLDDSIEQLFVIQNIATAVEQAKFEKLFTLLNLALDDSAFRKYDGSKFKGMFLDSAFEPIAIGLGANLESYDVNSPADLDLIRERIKSLWSVPDFLKNVGSGSNAKVRIPRLVALGKSHFLQ